MMSVNFEKALGAGLVQVFDCEGSYSPDEAVDELKTLLTDLGFSLEQKDALSNSRALLRSADKEIKEKDAALSGMKAENTRLSSEVSCLQHALNTKEKELSRLTQKNIDLLGELDTITEKIYMETWNKATAQIREKDEDISTLKGDVEESEDIIMNQRREIHNLKKDRENSECTAHDFFQQLQDAKKEISSYQENLKRVQDDLRIACQEIAELKSEKKRLVHDLIQAQDIISSSGLKPLVVFDEGTGPYSGLSKKKEGLKEGG